MRRSGSLSRSGEATGSNHVLVPKVVWGGSEGPALWFDWPFPEHSTGAPGRAKTGELQQAGEFEEHVIRALPIQIKHPENQQNKYRDPKRHEQSPRRVVDDRRVPVGRWIPSPAPTRLLLPS